MGKLTPAQQRVMKWLIGGHQALNLNSEVVEINGKRVCNMSTIHALWKQDLVEQVDAYHWRATEKAKAEAGK